MNIGPMSLPRSDNKKMDYTYSTCYYRLWYFFFLRDCLSRHGVCCRSYVLKIFWLNCCSEFPGMHSISPLMLQTALWGCLQLAISQDGAVFTTCS